MKYSKKEYLEAIKKMKQNILGEIEIATMMSDEKYIEQMNKKLEALDVMEKLLNDDFTHEDFTKSIDAIVYKVFNMESKNNFLLLIIYLRQICKEMFKLYNNGKITREEYDNVVLLDNELDKMVPYDKNNLFNRGKYIYISKYINKLTSQIKSEPE